MPFHDERIERNLVIGYVIGEMFFYSWCSVCDESGGVESTIRCRHTSKCKGCAAGHVICRSSMKARRGFIAPKSDTPSVPFSFHLPTFSFPFSFRRVLSNNALLSLRN